MAREEKSKIVLTAEDRTKRAFSAAASNADVLQKRFTGLSAGALGMGTALGLAAGALALMTKRSLENASALSDAADKIGVGIESLQEFRFGAEQAGVATTTLDMALQRFSRRVGEAAQGKGELTATLKQYNIAVKDSEGNTRAVEDVLDDYADAIANADSAQEQLRLSFKGFDSEGAALVNMLRRGSGGLEEMREEARRLGLVLDEDMVRQADAANDSLLRMNRIVGVNMQRVLIAMGPLIESFGTAFAEAAPHILDAANALIRFVGGPAMLGVQALSVEIGELETKIEGWQEKQVGLLESSREFIGFEVEINLARQKIDELAGFAEEKQKFIENLNLLGTAGTGVANDNDAADKIAAQERSRAEAMLRALEETHLQVMGREAELIDMRVAQDLEKLTALHEAKTISEMEFLEAQGAIYMTALERKLQLTEENEAAITAATKAEADRRAEIARDLADAEEAARRGLHDALGAIAALQNVQSRKMFEIGKAAAASLALVKTYEGAQSVFASAAAIPYVGWIIAPIAAAAAVVAGLANVRSILSTSFGGGASGGGGGSASVPTPSIPDVPALAPAANDTGPVRVLDVTIVGSAFSAEMVRDELIPLLNEAAGDGVTINATIAA